MLAMFVNVILQVGIESVVVGNEYWKLDCFHMYNLFYSMNRNDLQRLEVIVVLIVFISFWLNTKKWNYFSSGDLI
jgi:uncharacterized membrane protein